MSSKGAHTKQTQIRTGRVRGKLIIGKMIGMQDRSKLEGLLAREEPFHIPPAAYYRLSYPLGQSVRCKEWRTLIISYRFARPEGRLFLRCLWHASLRTWWRRKWLRSMAHSR